MNVLGGYNALERGESQELSFSWEQAQLALSSEDTLIFYIQRQPGIPDVDLRFSLNFPECWVLVESSDNPDELAPDFFVWVDSVQADTYYELRFETIANC